MVIRGHSRRNVTFTRGNQLLLHWESDLREACMQHLSPEGANKILGRTGTLDQTEQVTVWDGDRRAGLRAGQIMSSLEVHSKNFSFQPE